MVHRDCLYVFGGFFGYAGLAKPNGRRNDLWRFDFSTGWWTQLGAYGDLPCARSHHSMTVVNDRWVRATPRIHAIPFGHTVRAFCLYPK